MQRRAPQITRTVEPMLPSAVREPEHSAPTFYYNEADEDLYFDEPSATETLLYPDEPSAAETILYDPSEEEDFERLYTRSTAPTILYTERLAENQDTDEFEDEEEPQSPQERTLSEDEYEEGELRPSQIASQRCEFPPSQRFTLPRY